MTLPSLRSIKASLLRAPAMAGLFDFTGRLTQIRPSGGSTGEAELNNTLSSLWERALSITFFLLTLLAIIVLINAGIRYISSAGNPERTKVARATIINASLAIVLIVSVYSILRVIISVMTYFAGGAR